MKALFSLFIIILTITGCSKTQRVNKKLLGEWKVYNYKQQHVNGLSSIYETSGTIRFTESDNDNRFFYTEEIVYIEDGVEKIRKIEGLGTYTDSQASYFDLQLSSPNNQLIENCRIILLTKDDLKLEINDLENINYYILQKD